METLKRTLSKTDAESGRIYTSAMLPVDCSRITIECEGKRYDATYNIDNYCITGLGSLHKTHNAARGTIVSISQTQEKNVFLLHYQDKINSISNDEQDDDQKLSDLVEKIADCSCDNFEWFIGNETNVRSELIDPILKGLGWQFPQNIFREELCKDSKRKLVDYALYNDKPGNNVGFCLVIEAKAINYIFKSDDDEEVKQLASYLHDERFNKSLGILTNGIQWWLLDNDEQKSVIAKVNIYDRTNFVEFIKLFQYASFQKNRIQENVKGKFNDDSIDWVDKKDFYLIDNGTVFNKDNIVDTFNDFVRNHIKEIEEKDNLCFFTHQIVFDKAPGRNKKTTIKHRFFDREKRKYIYIIRDFGTYVKRALVRQIIHFCDLKNVDIKDK